MTLAQELAARLEQARANPDPERSAVYAKAAEALAAADVEENALRAGDVAPMFTLPDAFGNDVSLEEVLAHGPAIVSFYRGAWCPFCNLELRALQRELAAVEEAGATLVAISPNRPDVSLGVIEAHELTYPVLSDHDNLIAKQFNLVYEMIPEHVEYYRAHDRDIGAMNDTEAWELPVPATYVIDQDGVIRYAFIDLNHRVRAEPSEVIAVAASLTKG
ncbi:MAG TPA: peroxiredoxin-like family protein [Acidimicrobiia bacterium]|jgi:peroxiredoxin